MKLDYGELLEVGLNYIGSRSYFMHRHPKNRVMYIPDLPYDEQRRYCCMERDEEILKHVSRVTGIPQGTIVQAARQLNRYFERTSGTEDPSARIFKLYFGVNVKPIGYYNPLDCI